MKRTQLSTKGQVILPKSVRDAKQCRPGTEFTAEVTKEGVLLRPVKPFPPTRIEDVAGMLKYTGKPKTIEEMDEAVSEEVRRQYERGRY